MFLWSPLLSRTIDDTAHTKHHRMNTPVIPMKFTLGNVVCTNSNEVGTASPPYTGRRIEINPQALPGKLKIGIEDADAAL